MASAPAIEPAAAPPPRSSRLPIVLAALAVLIAAVVLGVVLAWATKDKANDRVEAAGTSSSRPSAPADEPLQASPPPVNEPATTAVESPQVASSPTRPTASIPPPTRATVTTAAPRPTSFPTNTVYSDEYHDVHIWLPTQMTASGVGDDYSSWAYGDVTFVLSMSVGATVDDADYLRQELLGQLTEVTTDTLGKNHHLDGSTIVSGFQSDGTALYTRFKIRCGDLVAYQVIVDPNPDATSRSIGGQIPKDLYSTTSTGDAMGGVRDSC